MDNQTKISNMTETDCKFLIFSVYVYWDKNKAGKTINARKNIKLLEYSYPNEYTANLYPLNWINKKTNTCFFETYLDGHDDETYGTATYLYFFPVSQFTESTAERIINSIHPTSQGFTLLY